MRSDSNTRRARFYALQIAETLGELEVETEKIWIFICSDATALWHTLVTKMDVFVNYSAWGFSAVGDIHQRVVWVCMDGPDDAAWLQALDEHAGLNAQVIHLQESCTFRVKNKTQKFQCKLTGDGKLMMVTTGGGGGCWWGCPDATGLVPIEGTLNNIPWGAFLRSVCILIGDYAHAGCRVTNAFKKRLAESITTLTAGGVGVQRIASEFDDVWSTLLADVKHVAPADSLFPEDH